ncbi:MAG TPA: ABC transporter permease [Thermoanaerobaculia bacterium]|nr:ABC transporter permease [Thermoanaerobaculia bacterium]
MENLVRDIRFAVRSILRKPLFAVIAVVSLALGIGANTAIFSLINEIFLRPLPIEQPDRVMAIFTTDERAGGQSPSSHLNWRDLREQNEVFGEVAGYDFAGISIQTGGEATVGPALLVSGNYFDTLGVRPYRGRFFLSEEDSTPGAHPVAVLHYGYWSEELGADESVVGRTITINGQPFTVVGVAAPGFHGLNVGFEPRLWLPMAMHRAIRTDPALNWYDERRGLFLFGFGRLRPGVDQATAQANVELIGARLQREYPDDNLGRSFEVQPIAETAVFNRAAVMAGTTLLMATVGLVLLIACANVANLLLARATERRKEIAIRLAMGIGRARLIRQLLTESLLVSLCGGALGLVVAFVSRDSLLGILGAVPGGPNLQLDLSIDGRVLLFTLGIALATGLLFGLLPAIQSSSPHLVAAIKDQGDLTLGPGRRFSARNALVVLQLALSVVALVGAGLFLRSLSAARAVDLGFETDRLAVISFDVGLSGYTREQGEQFFREARDRIASLPGVETTALSQTGPLQGTILRSVFLEGQNPEERTFVQVSGVGEGYFETLGVEIEAGRSFTDADRAGSVPVVIVNREMANRYWPGQEAVGQRFHFFGMEPVEVVGVAEVVTYQNPGEEPAPFAYLPVQQYYVTNTNVLARTAGDPSTVLLAAQAELRRMDPSLVINATTADALVENALAGQLNTALFLGILGGIALLLAAIGIYGVMSYTVRRRTRELGIRVALGASGSEVLGMVLRQGLALAGIGLAVGLVAALAVTRLMSQLLFVSPADPVAFAGTMVILALVALAACLAPALRASSVSPIIVLRYE